MTPYLFWQAQAKKITYIVIIFVVIPLLIPGCRMNEGKGTIQPDLPDTYNIDLERPTEQLSEKLIDDPSPEELQWPEDWLHGIPCESPCWQGITPGISTVTETITIGGRVPSQPSSLSPQHWDSRPRFLTLWILAIFDLSSPYWPKT